MNGKNNTITINKLIYIGIFVLIVCLIFVVSKYIQLDELFKKIFNSFIPVLIAILVSFIIEPFVDVFSNKGIKRKYSVILAYFFVLIVIGLAMILTVPSLVSQVQIFISSVPLLINDIVSFVGNLGIGLGSNVSDFLNNIFLNLYSSIIKLLGSSLSIIYNVLLGLSGAIFLSFDFQNFRNSVKKHIPKRIKEPVIFYFHHFLPLVRKYFFGMFIDSIIIFIISIIGFSIIGLDYVLIISIFICVTNLIPIIGPYIGGVPAVIIGFTSSYALGISSLVVVVVVQLIESVFVQPIILKNVISLHPLEGILGISLFGTLFGVIGMILSPILIVSIKLLFLPYDAKQALETI